MLLVKEQMDAKKNTSEASVLRSSTAEGGPLVAIVDDDASVRVSTLRLLRWSGLRAEPSVAPRSCCVPNISPTPLACSSTSACPEWMVWSCSGGLRKVAGRFLLSSSAPEPARRRKIVPRRRERLSFYESPSARRHYSTRFMPDLSGYR